MAGDIRELGDALEQTVATGLITQARALDLAATALPLTSAIDLTLGRGETF